MTVKYTVVIKFAILIAAMNGCTGNDTPDRADNGACDKIGPFGVLHRNPRTTEEPVTPSTPELKKKEVAERLDTAGLLYTGKVVVDKDFRMLEPPEEVARFAGKDYVIASEPPEIEFAVVPVEPPWLNESPVKITKDISGYQGPWKPTEIDNTPGPWTHWTQGNYDSRTGKFYTSAGDHGKYDAHIFIVEYDPAQKKITCFPEINKVLGRTRTQFSEGKLHGWLDFYRSGRLERPHLWFITYWCKYPEPDEEDYATGYRGGHIMSLDVETGDMVDYGVPIPRASFPYHRIDTTRGIMYAVGMFGEFLAWDIEEQRTRWAGYLPAGMAWWNRAIMIDEVTGLVYTTNMHESDTKRHLIAYDPDRNRFRRLDCHMPMEHGDPVRGEGEGGYGHMRCQTRRRGPDGLFWGITYGGELFSFDPENETVEDRGVCWPHPQRYTCSMERSPGGRYLYYVPCSPRFYYTAASPIVQYDTETGRIKVLAFTWPFYREKYGFTTSQNFSLKLDDAGEKLFVVWNGGFVEHETDGVDDTFGQVAVMLVNIPESERRE
ncbi:MAG: hypothetical protein J7M24_06410 [Candidatus Latescibacteria bacterium]|nr:hypothetical protein [Candidatus Latescibacterota bacterium]